MEVKNRTWREVIELLATDYTLSIRDVCKLLKASRSWVNKYIKPHVRSIYLNSNKRGGINSPLKCNWVRMAAIELNKPDMTESVWLNKKDVLELLERSITSVTKQTKFVPVSCLMPPETATIYIKEYSKLEGELKEAKGPLERMEGWKKLDALHVQFLGKRERELIKHGCSIIKRGDVPRLDVTYPGKFEPERWIAAHDIKDYGDTDEDIYRRFFRGGYIRIELSVPDVIGEIGTKIYYIPDPEPLFFVGGRAFIVPEIEWVRYLNA